jgi:hypothetical protein
LNFNRNAVTAVDSVERALEVLEMVIYKFDHIISLLFCLFLFINCISNGERGFILQQQPSVDMIITDYCMPEMTGYELLRRVKVSSYSILKPSKTKFYKMLTHFSFISLNLLRYFCMVWFINGCRDQES